MTLASACPCRARRGPARKSAARSLLAVALTAVVIFAADASAEDAARWLERAAQAARTLNYAGTIVYQHNGHVETSRLVHLFDGGQEQEKLVSLDGPAREVIRSSAEVRCYFPDDKVIRIEPRTFRNVFPSLSAEQAAQPGPVLRGTHGGQRAGRGALDAGDDVRAQGRTALWPQVLGRRDHRASAQGPPGRRSRRSRRAVCVHRRGHQRKVRPRHGQAVVGHRAAGLAGQARLVRRNAAARKRAGPSADSRVGSRRSWKAIARCAASANRSRTSSIPTAWCAISVFVEPIALPAVQTGVSQQGGLNVYTTKNDDHLITVLGEAPPAAVRQIAQSVAKR